jgi:REP element-mobilizing transposase RayT
VSQTGTTNEIKKTMNINELKYGIRNSKMMLGEAYFWTDTIKDWRILLSDSTCKDIIINCWRDLVNRKKIQIYGFVIMPNHLHILWEMINMNGKEMPYASFNKFTSHQFLDHLRKTFPDSVTNYREVSAERKHRFWQRDPLAICMDSKNKAEQKLDYIHLNPLQEKWSLVTKPEDYKWSSARFYETGIDEFEILTDYRERL